MQWPDFLGHFSPLDLAAVTLIFVVWFGISWRIEHLTSLSPSVSVLMAEFRREWMYQMVDRDPRIFDAQLISSLRQGAAFFASASMIALGGGLALIGNAERLAGLANDLILNAAPRVVWEIKLLLCLLFLVNAFLKFVWAHRLFGYTAVLMAAVPKDASDPLSHTRADQAAEVSIAAARSFNRGMRATYFGLAATAWLAGAAALILAVIFTLGVLWRREFSSRSRGVLLANRAPNRTPSGDQAR